MIQKLELFRLLQWVLCNKVAVYLYEKQPETDCVARLVMVGLAELHFHNKRSHGN